MPFRVRHDVLPARRPARWLPPKQLLQETAHQRDAVRAERTQLASQLKFAERRIAALEEERARLDAELVSERAARQTAAGEASAFKAVTASQRAQLDELLRATLAAAPPAAKAARASRSTAKPAGKPDHKPSSKPGSKRRDPS